MFTLVIEPKVMSICGPDCYEPFWEPTTVRTLTLAFPHLCSASHCLSCARNTYFKHISILFSPPLLSKIINSSFLLVPFLHHLFMFRLSSPKGKGRNPSIIPDCAVSSFTNTLTQFISANSAAPHSPPRGSVAFAPPQDCTSLRREWLFHPECPPATFESSVSRVFHGI
uniref:Uncharacterized protein n=1 Tax=Myotis myotis TaxID=51298 RepID=A0A7J7U5K5_MYOMY|nr:hypothetical protein mMyoMyo1_008880 [Myotis myotis]